MKNGYSIRLLIDRELSIKDEMIESSSIISSSWNIVCNKLNVSVKYFPPINSILSMR